MVSEGESQTSWGREFQRQGADLENAGVLDRLESMEGMRGDASVEGVAVVKT